MKQRIAVGIGILCVLLAAPRAAGDHHRDAPKASLTTVEGTVRSVSALPGEGELAVLAISLRPDSRPDEELTILLAPEQALTGLGFAVESGDRCRIRIFRSDEGPSKAHKVLNLSRGTMVRLRTLRQIPLWDGAGSWQGGPCQSGAGSGAGNGAGGHHHRGGR